VSVVSPQDLLISDALSLLLFTENMSLEDQSNLKSCWLSSWVCTAKLFQM